MRIFQAEFSLNNFKGTVFSAKMELSTRNLKGVHFTLDEFSTDVLFMMGAVYVMEG